MKTHRILAALIGIACSSGFAAQQGTLGATSTGSFTNTFNATGLRQVQVLGLFDATVSIDSGMINAFTSSPGTPVQGVADNFCVVDTYGGAVGLTVTANEYSATTLRPVARAASGSILGYQLSMESVANPGFNTVMDSTQPTQIVPNGFSDASQCGGGNMRKAIHAMDLDGGVIFDGLLPTNGNVYFSQVTITATPN